MAFSDELFQLGMSLTMTKVAKKTKVPPSPTKTFKDSFTVETSYRSKYGISLGGRVVTKLTRAQLEGKLRSIGSELANATDPTGFVCVTVTVNQELS